MVFFDLVEEQSSQTKEQKNKQNNETTPNNTTSHDPVTHGTGIKGATRMDTSEAKRWHIPVDSWLW